MDNVDLKNGKSKVSLKVLIPIVLVVLVLGFCTKIGYYIVCNKGLATIEDLNLPKDCSV